MSPSAAEIRQQFIDFFRAKEHTFAVSSPVVPLDDPTLLFTNAGMNQFKDVFLGTGSRPYVRAANTQKCIRAGGKHNDLDDVGKDTYHHTFFEMLGNWSFGDYFKAEAIRWAWELLVDVWGIDPQRLHATYFEGDAADGVPADDEARDLWREFLPDERIHTGNKKDNFWEMGDTGPCGPCSELHIDLTPDKNGGALINADDPRVIEIWNLVFIQFNRAPDGALSPLPARHVDTGMGFERVAAVLQGKTSNYDTDVFAPLFAKIRELTGAEPYRGLLPGASAPVADILCDTAYRVIADHVRCLTFALTDGAVPDKEGRGYVLRRILRRGVRYAWQYFDAKEPLLHRLVPTVVESMGAAFPELTRDPQHVIDVIRDEEESFARTLERGIALFEDARTRAAEHKGEITGEDAFKLHDTYGFPIDLTQIMAEEKGLRINVGEYERLMAEARERARGEKRSSDRPDLTPDELVSAGPCDDSFKFAAEPSVKATIQTIAQRGDQVVFQTDKTAFYAEQGGQTYDIGRAIADGMEIEITEVERRGDSILHYGTVSGDASGLLGTSVELAVAPLDRRGRIKQNHTATHLLNWALREVLGDHVQQKGSLVDDEKTRFDFSHPQGLKPEEAAKIESLVNEQIARSHAVDGQEVPQADALKITGLRAVFGEKYPDLVRVLSIGPSVDELLAKPDNAGWAQHSIEFCGGTHCSNTAEIRRFALIAEESVSKGVRRVVGVTGEAAVEAVAAGQRLRDRAATLLETEGDVLATGTAELQAALAETSIPLHDRHQLRDDITKLQKKMKAAQKQAAAGAFDVVKHRCEELLAAAESVGDVTIVVGELPDAPMEQIKQGADLIKQKSGAAAVFFASNNGEKVALVASVSDDLVKRGVKSGDWIKATAKLVGGGGGGSPTMAQAGGKNPAGIPEALTAAQTWIREKLAE